MLPVAKVYITPASKSHRMARQATTRSGQVPSSRFGLASLALSDNINNASGDFTLVCPAAKTKGRPKKDKGEARVATAFVMYLTERLLVLCYLLPDYQGGATMSTLAYAQLTNMRDLATPGTSSTTSPGVGTYADTLAALVPAEVLSVHALVISATTEMMNNGTIITDMSTLKLAFWGFILVSIGFYIVPRWFGGRLDRLDFLRVLIPPLAFIGWTMLQRTTAFDAAFPSVTATQRTVIGLFLAIVLAAGAAAFAYSADQKPAK